MSGRIFLYSIQNWTPSVSSQGPLLASWQVSQPPPLPLAVLSKNRSSPVGPQAWHDLTSSCGPLPALIFWTYFIIYINDIIYHHLWLTSSCWNVRSLRAGTFAYFVLWCALRTQGTVWHRLSAQEICFGWMNEWIWKCCEALFLDEGCELSRLYEFME